jgi:hypothetical protein
MNIMPESYPIYILDNDQIVFPPEKNDIGHCEFWETTVHKIVAELYRIPARKLINLPYCQRRARIYNSKVYYGETFKQSLLLKIKKAVGEKLEFAYDEHEARLEYDVLLLNNLIGPCQ